MLLWDTSDCFDKKKFENIISHTIKNRLKKQIRNIEFVIKDYFEIMNIFKVCILNIIKPIQLTNLKIFTENLNEPNSVKDSL